MPKPESIQELTRAMLAKFILILSISLLVLALAISYSSGRRLIRNYPKIVALTIATLASIIALVWVMQG